MEEQSSFYRQYFQNTVELHRNILEFSFSPDLRWRYQRVTVAATTMRFNDSLQSQIEHERVAHRLQGENVRQLHALVQYDVRPGVHRRVRNHQVAQLSDLGSFRELRLRDQAAAEQKNRVERARHRHP